MNISTSECSSGCESGWTMYLDQLSNNSNNPHNMQDSYQEKGGYIVNDDQEDEDLSMVSDASSGPPNVYGDEPRCFASPQQDKKTKKSKQKSKSKETRMTMMKKNQSLCLDDTASSPFLHFSQDNALTHENDNSTSNANYEEEHMPKKNLGFFKSSIKGKSGSLQGRKNQ